ncbi:LysR family transcriptional regulator [Gallaecimonas mangrovi]|uniref:LysR family transcriptional regulator n=1 Tax=Gallaecimonas mangrovi TaxID=2291597 RepID=UPI000E209F48|nr:LysR family transcriptional regulator [Gallaecimonas mangrovi]
MNNADRIEMMRTLVRIIESGSLSAAARQLGTTQPTVSRRLVQLESLLGAKLLLRSTHGMKLTDEGERCYQQARTMLANWDALAEDLAGNHDEPVGMLRVRVPHAFGQQQMMPHLLALLKRYPGLSVEWVLNDKTPDFLAENIDCAVHVGAVEDPSLVAVLLAEVPRLMVASPDLIKNTGIPQQVEQLASLPWVAQSPYHRREVLLRHQKSQAVVQVDIAPRLISDSLYAVYHAALMGIGVTTVSAWIATEAINDGRLQALLPQWQPDPLPVYLVYPYANYYPAKMRRFFTLMKTVMPNLVGTTPPSPAELKL